MALNLRNKFWFVVMSCSFRFIFAVTFIVSGCLKSMDPQGTILAMESYLAAYNLVAPDWLVTFVSVGLGAAELILGCMLLLNIFIRITSVVAMVVISFFTILTLLSATVVPVEDCGCFGDIIKLTPWQTFAKNMVLLPMTICFWYHYRKEQCFETWKKDLILLLVFSTLAIGFSLYSYLHLPIFDATPYKKGVNIAEAMTQTEEQTPQENVVLVYRNRQTNELREFSLEDTAWQQDSVWVHVDTRVKEGNAVNPTLLEFYVCDATGDKTKEILSKPKLYMLFMDSAECDEDVHGAFFLVEQYAKVNGGDVVYITPENTSSILTEYPCYNMDPKTMKTILRADYGLVVLEKGVIAEKYNYRDIPY